MTDIGNNSASAVAPDLLKSFVERIESLNEEIDGLSNDKRDVYAESKSQGFDVKILKQVIRIRQQDTSKRREEEEILELYKAALGMLS